MRSGCWNDCPLPVTITSTKHYVKAKTVRALLAGKRCKLRMAHCSLRLRRQIRLERLGETRVMGA
eukprot:scaffold7197_cov88-Skeletonema_menzelii.AAC.7